MLLKLVQWTLGPGPRMSWERYWTESGANWINFNGKIDIQYNSSIVYIRTRENIITITLRNELSRSDDGSRSTRYRRAITCVVEGILKLAKDLPRDERTDSHLVNFFRMFTRGVEFTKYAQINLSNYEETSFNDLSLAIQTPAQIED